MGQKAIRRLGEVNERPNMGIGGITPAMKLKMAA